MRFVRYLIVGLSFIVWNPGVGRPQDAATPADSKEKAGAFLVKPFLQLGNNAAGGAADGLVLAWQTGDVNADWSLEYRPGADRAWVKADVPAMRRIAVSGVPPHRLYRVALKGLVPGRRFAYRLKKAGETVFDAEGPSPKASDQPYRFVAFGDCGVNGPEQKQIAYRTYQERPDFVFIPGDIVYDRGRISEYLAKFWPIYNADEASPSMGAPLMRSTLFLAAPGNHDVATRDLQRYPDGLAYFLYWDQPLNGPLVKEGSSLVPALKGPEANQKAFLDAAGSAYPRMANFSFYYGNAHWTVLDSNPYVDWREPELRAWVEHDLAAACGATWRFVAFHHPGLQSAKEHFEQQQMRVMAEVFEKGRVDIVFSGHVHNYQRSFPMRFVPEKDEAGKPVRIKSLVGGKWTLDKSFDGRSNTHPDGVIYLVTGAGGQHLYNPEQQEDPASWQPFTDKFVSKVNSLTVVDVRGPSLSVRQLAADGQELDRFTVEKR
ncbi:MAG: metallophosphoesterase [Isosphaeraceae bacterium]